MFKQIKYRYTYKLDHCSFLTTVKLFKTIQLKTYLVVNSIKYFSEKKKAKCIYTLYTYIKLTLFKKKSTRPLFLIKF